MKTEAIHKFLYKYRTLKKVEPNDFDEALSELIEIEIKRNNYEDLKTENERLRAILKHEDICPECGENEASRFCKCY